MMNASGNFFSILVQYVLLHPRRVILSILLFSVFALLSAMQLRVDPNIIKLLPPEEPATKELLRINEEEGGTHFLNVSIRGGEKEVRQEKLSFIVEQIQNRVAIDYVIYDLSDLPQDQKLQLGLMQLSVEDLASLNMRLQQALTLGPGMLNPMIASQLFSLGALSKKVTAQNIDSNSEICLSQIKEGSKECGELVQMIIRPKGSPFDNDFSIPFMEEIYAILDEAKLEEVGMEVAWVGGAYRHTVEDVEVVIYDVSRTAGLSLLLVLFFITIIYREKRALIIIFVPLLVGNLWTWGFTYWVIGELNTFTSFSSAILLGLGVDFAIHLYSRYQEEKKKFETPKEALVHTWTRVGPPCAAAAATSAGGFLALRFGNFLGFQQLGIILSGGILLCLISVLVILPLMVMWREGQDKPLVVQELDETKIPKGVSYRFSGIILAGVIGLAFVCFPYLQKIQIDYDLSNLRKKGMAYSELNEAERKLADENFPPVIIEFSSKEELYRAHKLFEKVVQEKSDPFINGSMSIFSILPFHQEEKIGLIQKIANQLSDPNAKYLPKEIRSNLEPLQSLEAKEIQKEDLPLAIQQLLGTSSHRLLLFPMGNMWDVRENNKMAISLSKYLQDTRLLGVEEKDILPKIEEPLNNSSVVGEYIARSALFRQVKDDAPKIGVLAFVMIFFLSFLDIRSLYRSISAALVLGLGLTFAGMSFWMAGLSISMISFVGIPILMGIGIDIIIHLIHRIGEEGKGRINIALRTTGKAAVYSTLTTIFSFMSLLIASNRGIQSLGHMTVQGLFVIAICAFVVVPLGWMFVWTRQKE